MVVCEQPPLHEVMVSVDVVRVVIVVPFEVVVTGHTVVVTYVISLLVIGGGGGTTTVELTGGT